MIHKVTYDCYELDDTGKAGRIPDHEDLVVYTDLEIDEIRRGIEAMWQRVNRKRVRVIIKEQKVRHGNLLQASDYSQERIAFYRYGDDQPDEEEEGSGLLNPDEL